MLTSLRTRILLTCLGIVVGALAFTGILNYFVTRSYNDESIRQEVQSVGRGHIVGIDDWITSKMQMVLALQDVALSVDPLGIFKAVADAGGFINVFVVYPDKSYKFSNPEGVPANYDPTTRAWYREVVAAAKPIVVSPYISALNGKLVVSFAVPILRDSSLKGVVVGTVSMDTVIANVKANCSGSSRVREAFKVADHGECDSKAPHRHAQVLPSRLGGFNRRASCRLLGFPGGRPSAGATCKQSSASDCCRRFAVQRSQSQRGARPL